MDAPVLGRAHSYQRGRIAEFAGMRELIPELLLFWDELTRSREEFNFAAGYQLSKSFK